MQITEQKVSTYQLKVESNLSTQERSKALYHWRNKKRDGELVEVYYDEICLKMKGTKYPAASIVALWFGYCILASQILLHEEITTNPKKKTFQIIDKPTDVTYIHPFRKISVQLT